MNDVEFLLPENRKEAVIVCAAVALHSLIASGLTIIGEGEADHNQKVVRQAFNIAYEFLRQAETL